MRRVGVLLLLMSVELVSCTALPPPQEWFHRTSAPPAPFTLRPPPPDLAELSSIDWAEALRIAREQSPTLGAAVERIRRAEALVREAAALSYPRLDARASYVRFIEASNFRGRTGGDVSGEATRSRFVTGRGSDIYSGGVDVSYPLFDGGDAYYGRKATEAGLEASRHDADAVRSDLAVNVSTAFINVLLVEGAIQIAAESLEFTQAQERRARAREAVGEGLRVDTLRFATNASAERLALNRVRAEKRILLAVLSELLGVPLPEDVELVAPETGLEIPAGDLVALAIDRRPEMHAARARIAAASSRVARQSARWWPAVDLFASYGVLSLDDLKLSQEEDEFQVGGALSMNLFEGGASVARTDALRRELAELEHRQSELALAIEREVREAASQLEVARRNIEVSREAVTLAEEVLSRISAQYEAGEAQVIDVTEATLQRTRAQLAFLRSRVDLLLSQAHLRRAMGLGLLRDEI